MLMSFVAYHWENKRICISIITFNNGNPRKLQTVASKIIALLRSVLGASSHITPKNGVKTSDIGVPQFTNMIKDFFSVKC